VAEILRHALKVDFWDVPEMAAKIIAVLRHPALASELASRAHEELHGIRWERAAERIVAVYGEALAGKIPSKLATGC
jgi:glycosyltransferase involved in cell wall biosynthesis